MFLTKSQLEVVDVCTGNLTQKQTCLWWTRLSWAEHTRTSQVTALFMSLPLGIFQKDALSNRCVTLSQMSTATSWRLCRSTPPSLCQSWSCNALQVSNVSHHSPMKKLQCPAGKQYFKPLKNERVKAIVLKWLRGPGESCLKLLYEL